MHISVTNNLFVHIHRENASNWSQTCRRSLSFHEMVIRKIWRSSLKTFCLMFLPRNESRNIKISEEKPFKLCSDNSLKTQYECKHFSANSPKIERFKYLTVWQLLTPLSLFVLRTLTPVWLAVMINYIYNNNKHGLCRTQCFMWWITGFWNSNYKDY